MKKERHLIHIDFNEENLALCPIVKEINITLPNAHKKDLIKLREIIGNSNFDTQINVIGPNGGVILSKPLFIQFARQDVEGVE